MPPLRTEVVTLEELNESEGEQADGEVEAVSGELPAGKMIEAVVMFEFADHFLEQSSVFVEVDDRLSLFLFLWNVGGNDPVVVFAVEEIALMVTTGTFHNETKGVGAIAECVDGLSELVIGSCAIGVSPLFPGVFWDVENGLHHSGVVISGDGETPSVVEAIVKNKLIEAYRVNTDRREGTRGVVEALVDE